MKKLFENKYIQKYWHILILFLFSLLPLVWFLGKGNALINGVDTNFPLNPTIWLMRRFYMWNGLSNGGADFSFAPAGIFFHVVQFVPHLLGLSLQVVEKVSLIFWFGLIVFSSYIFSGNFVKENKILRLLFVSLYALNIYMFNSWENIKVANLSLVAAIPLLLHVFINLNSKQLSYIKAGFILVFASLVLSGAGINPAYFITAFVSLLIFGIVTISMEGDIKKTSKNLLFILVVILLVGSYWVVPTISFVLRNVNQASSIGSIGFTDWLDSLSQNSSIINILRLQGAWDWYAFDSVTKEPLYLPYALNYFYKIPFIAFSFIIPSISLASLVFIGRGKIKYYLSFAAMLILGVFLGGGSHEPTGIFFRWLTVHVPYFSLFRSPWYIFTPLLTLALAGLTTLFFDYFNKINIVKYIALSLIVFNTIYCYPLVTGKIFRPSRSDGFYVNFPDYIFEVGNKLSSITSNRIITYPDDQLEKFNWGYIGVEPVINLFSNNEMVFAPINNTDSFFSKIVSKIYDEIKAGNITSLSNLASKLNVDTILEKKDQQTLSQSIEKYGDWEKIQSGDWLIHKINKNIKSNNKISLANNFYIGIGDSDDRVNQISILDSTKHLLNPDDSVIEKNSNLKNNSGVIISAKNSQYTNYTNPEFKSSDPTVTNYEFKIVEDGWYSPVLEKKYVVLFDNAINVISNNQNQIWRVSKLDDSYIYFEKMYLTAGNYKYTYKVENNLVFKSQHDVSLVSSSGDKYTEFIVPDFDFQRPYLITFDYNWSYGNEASFLISQYNEKNALKTKKIDLGQNYFYSNFGFYFTPVETNSVVKISFLNKKDGNLTDYRNLKIYKVFTNNLMFIKDSNFNISMGDLEFDKISPVKYVGSVKDIKNPQTLIFNDNYSNDWKIKITDLNGNKIRHRVDHFSINLYANAWYIDTVNQDFKFEIYYDPQKYFNIGLVVSGITVALILLAYVKNYKKN